MNERATPARLRIDARREAVRRLAGEGLSNVAIGEILGVTEGTIRNDLGSQNCGPDRKASTQNSAETEPASQDSECEPQPSAVAESVARAYAAVVAVLPGLEAGARLEFYSRALSLVADVRRTGDGEAVRLAEELCRKLAGMRPIPPRA
jgi:hypothetical protein